MKREELLEQYKEPISVLDKGHVRLVDVMGDDSSVVQAARVSYGAGTKTLRKDRGLIRYLMRNRHTSPFEMCEIKLHVRVTMDCWRQWIRHRTANVNEYSTRYSIALEDKQRTASDEWREQAKDNKQGSGGYVPKDVGQLLTAREDELHVLVQEVYDERLEAGVAREQARKDLPLCTYTEAYWKIDLHNLFHFLSLRKHGHAQKEIREFADAISTIVADWVPLCYEAFEDYVLYASRFSRMEMEALRQLLEDVQCDESFLKKYELSNREIKEFYNKLLL